MYIFFQIADKLRAFILILSIIKGYSVIFKAYETLYIIKLFININEPFNKLLESIPNLIIKW